MPARVNENAVPEWTNGRDITLSVVLVEMRVSVPFFGVMERSTRLYVVCLTSILRTFAVHERLY